jgi:hypothetical protein
MTWQLATVVNGVIAVSYFAIATLITRGLWKSGQIATNILGVATALIFFSCGGGHLLHAVHYVADPATRGLADLHITLWDGLTAMIAVWYLSLRGRYSQLVKGTAMFEDQQRAAIEEQLRQRRRLHLRSRRPGRRAHETRRPGDVRSQVGRWRRLAPRDAPPGARSALARGATPLVTWRTVTSPGACCSGSRSSSSNCPPRRVP